MSSKALLASSLHEFKNPLCFLKLFLLLTQTTMVRTRNGSKRKEKSPLATPKIFYDSDPDYPCSPPFPVQSTASPSMRMCPLGNIKKSVPSLTSTLKAARRVTVGVQPILKNEFIKSLLLSSPDVKPSGPPNLIVQSHVGRDAPNVATLPASNQDIRINSPSSRENCVISHLKDTMPEKSTKSSRCLSSSVNLTEFVKRQLDEEDDDEVQSALDPSFDCVNGHKVKRENVPLLRAIFDKYGDITKESKGQPPAIVSFFLERVCAIYERLKGTQFSKVTHKDLTEMLDEVRFLEREKINLGWLHQKLEHIYNTKVSSQNYLNVKEDCEKCDNTIKSLEEKLEVHKREVSLMEEKLVEEKDKADQYKKMACDIKTRVNDLRARSLVHGLL